MHTMKSVELSLHWYIKSFKSYLSGSNRFLLDTNYEEHETDTDLIEGIKQALQSNKLVEDEMEFFVRVRFPTLNTKLKKLRTDHYLTQARGCRLLKN